MGVSAASFRRLVPAFYTGEELVPGGEGAATIPVGGSVKEDWDTEGPLETFKTGQTLVAVVVSGVGPHKVVAPVVCSRKSTSCAFCDTASSFSCVHALRCRSIPRVHGSKGPTKKTSGAADAAQSSKSLPAFNCPRSVKIDMDICGSMQAGKMLRVSAPVTCVRKHPAENKGDIKVDAGEIMCSMGFCGMELESFYCNHVDCCCRVYPDGREDCVVILSSSTAATVVVLRDMAREVTTGGSTFGACYRRWHNKYSDLRDSGVYPAMMAIKPKSRQTVTGLFFLALKLLCKEPPLWAFRCNDCQDKDGRFRIVTGDGIWMGFLLRLASTTYEHPSQPCASVKAIVDAASIHPSEWVRRFLRSSLKQPSKAVVVKSGQLRSAKRALAFLCPDALPDETEDLSEDKKSGLLRLHVLLKSVWSLPGSSLSLCDGIVVYLKKILGRRSTMTAVEVMEHQATLDHLLAWKVEVVRRNMGNGEGGGNGLIPGAVDNRVSLPQRVTLPQDVEHVVLPQRVVLLPQVVLLPRLVVLLPRLVV
eukprot:contig_8607_g2017